MSYRDILRGAELKAEYDKYQLWLGKSRSEKQDLYDTLNVSKFTYNKSTYYVAPFAQPNKALFVAVEQVAAGTTSPGDVALSLGGSFFTANTPVGAADIILNSSQFPKSKLAKMIVKRFVSKPGTKSQSRITGRKYFRTVNNSVSVFLGKNAISDGFDDVVSAIKELGGYDTFNDVAGNSITFIPEG